MKQPVIELSKQVSDARYVSFAQPEGRARASVELIYGGRETCSPEYLINRSGFPVYLMEYVQEGTGDLVLQGQVHTLRRGCLYFYGPGIPCKIVSNSKRPLAKYFFAFHCRGQSLEERYQLGQLYFGANRGGDLVAGLVQQLFDEACVSSEYSARICSQFLDIILLKCARNQLMEQHYRERAFQVFRRVKATIEDNYLELHRLPDVALAVDLDASYISRLFKRYYHMTPYTFLQQKKMEHALNLLRQGNCSVREAASAVGFEDPFHFSRVFKKFKGISPSQSRE